MKTLFVIFEIKPYKDSTGKPQFFITDVGLLNFLKASFDKKLRTWFYLELLSQISYKGLFIRDLYFYRNTKGSIIDLIYEEKNELVAVKLIYSEHYDQRDYNLLQAIADKYQNQFKTQLFALCGTHQILKNSICKTFPWEIIC